MNCEIGDETVSCTTLFALVLDLTASEQLFYCTAPLTVRDAGGGMDIGFGVPSGMGL